MLSSTSSSSGKPSWKRVWLLAAALALTALTSWEMLWRWRGVESGFRDDRALWSHARSRLGSEAPWRSVIVGSSRAQVDIDPELLAPVFDDVPPVVLAIDGASPQPVLSHLAEHGRYGGVLLLEINPLHVFASSPEWDDSANEFIDHYLELPRIGVREIDLRLTVQEHLASLNPALGPKRIVRGLFADTAHEPRHLTLRADRHLEVDFDADATDALRSQLDYYRSKGKSTPIEPVLDAIIRESRTLRSNGGEVVLLRLPSSGEVREAEKLRFPRARYWEVLVERSGLPAIHFEDYPELSEFDCPDGSHLNLDDAKEFARRLAPILDRTLARQTLADGS